MPAKLPAALPTFRHGGRATYPPARASGTLRHQAGAGGGGGAGSDKAPRPGNEEGWRSGGALTISG